MPRDIADTNPPVFEGWRPCCARFGSLRVRVLRWTLVVAMCAISFPRGAWAAEVDASDKTACTAAAERAQRLRDEGRYRDARRDLMFCSQEICPAVVKRDCIAWYEELQESQPTLVVSAKAADGTDVRDARVLIDGAVVAERIDGLPVPVDPGPHEIKLEAKGRAPVVAKFVVQAGQKNRLVQMDLPAEVGKPERPQKDKPAAATKGSGLPVLTYVFGGLGVVALGSATYFGVRANGELNELRAQPCAASSSCDPAEVDAIRDRAMVADVSLAIGIACLGVATIIGWMHHGSHAPVAAHAIR